MSGTPVETVFGQQKEVDRRQFSLRTRHFFLCLLKAQPQSEIVITGLDPVIFFKNNILFQNQ